jgi:stress response protein YsnF
MPDSDRQAALALARATEQIETARRLRALGRVRAARPSERWVPDIDLGLGPEEVEVERVPVGRRVAAPPPLRREGDQTVIPVVEEVTVVERRLILAEEIRVRRVARG